MTKTPRGAHYNRCRDRSLLLMVSPLSGQESAQAQGLYKDIIIKGYVD